MSNLFDLVDEKLVDYERDRKIDVHNLHEEWLRQPELMGKYIKLMAQAERDRDQIKKYLEVCRANLEEAKALLEEQIRLKPEKYNPPTKKTGEIDTKESWFSLKINSESKIDDACIKASGELAKTQDALIEATYKVNIYNAGVKAMQDRKAALEHEVFLWSKGYFSVPNLPRPLLEEYQEPQKAERDERAEVVRQAIQPVEWKEISSPSQRRRRS